MAHMMKMTKAASGHMFLHYERAKDGKGEYVRFGNQDIKPVNTVLNYNLAYDDQPQRQLDFLHQRLSEIKVHNRKDVNVMVDWVVTLPQSLNGKGFDDEERFFKEAYKFLNDRYGKENVISAYVHMDETTPHMHYAFIPVVEDKKNGGYKLSAKEAITRKDLQTFHKDLSNHMERVFGRDIGILNEATKEGNKSIEELKRGTAQEKLKIATLEAATIVSKAQDDIKPIEEHKRALQSEIEGLQRDILTARQVKDVPHTKALIGDKQVVTTEDFNALCKTAATAEALLKEIVPARKINARAKEMIRQAEEKANTIIENAKHESLQTVIQRERKVSDLEKKLSAIEERLNKAFSFLSESVKGEFLSAWNKAIPQEKKHTKGLDRDDRER